MQAAALYRSSIGKKAVMAISGLIWIGYVVMHMYGNLKAFYGQAYFNEYAEGLRSLGSPLFAHLHLLTIARLVFVLSIVLHVWSAWSLYRQAREARPASYTTRKVVQANYASLTMRLGGTVILLFIIFHLVQLTWKVPGVDSEYVFLNQGDPYTNLITAFQSPIITIIYLVALVALGFHLFHGTWSMFQTLGLKSRSYDRAIRWLAVLIAVVVPVGFAMVPIAVQLGILN